MTELSDEEYFKKHLEERTNAPVPTNAQPEQKQQQKIIGSDRVTDLQYFSFDASELPHGKFYQKGVTILIRAAQTDEIQAYSMVSDDNFYDMVEKMDDMLTNCVRVKYPDGTVASYLDIKEGDRYYLIFVIRDLTFQKGPKLTSKQVTCKCKEKTTIDYTRNNFVFHELDPDLMEFYDEHKRLFIIPSDWGNKEIGIPSIGLQKSFTDWLLKKHKEDKDYKVNLSFLKIQPYLISTMTSITPEGIDKKLAEYEALEPELFAYLDSVVSMIKVGISGLKKKCTCGVEVHTDEFFPERPSSIFTIQNPLKKFIKK